MQTAFKNKEGKDVLVTDESINLLKQLQKTSRSEMG